jgi:hypothetical protein
MPLNDRQGFIDSTLARLEGLHKDVSSKTGFWSSLTTVFADDSIKSASDVGGKAIETLKEVSRTRDMFDPKVWGDWVDLAETTDRSLSSALNLSSNYSTYQVAKGVTWNFTQNTAAAVSSIGENLPGATDKLMYLMIAAIVMMLVFKFAF